MKTKIVLFILFFSCMTFVVKGQDSTKSKHLFFIDIGGNYNFFYENRFIDSIPTYLTTDSHIQHYAGYTIVPAYGIHFGLLYEYILKNKYVFEIGLLYNNRKCIFESDTNKLRVYKNWHSPEYEDVIKYDVSSNNIEAEFDLGYYYKRFSFFAGAKIFLASFEKRKLTFINGKHNTTNGFSHNIFNGLYYIELYPEIKFCYSLPVKNYNAQIYFGIDKSMSISRVYYKKSVFFVYGIKLPFFKT